MSKKVRLDLEVSDNFVIGDCNLCPLHYVKEFYDEDDGYDDCICCPLDDSYQIGSNCPLKEIRKKK